MVNADISQLQLHRTGSFVVLRRTYAIQRLQYCTEMYDGHMLSSEQPQKIGLNLPCVQYCQYQNVYKDIHIRYGS